MKKLLLWFSFVGFSLNVIAEQTVNESLEVDEKSDVKIEHVNGRAQIKAWDKLEVKVQGILGDRTEQFLFEKDGDEVIIKVKVKNNNGWGSWGSDDKDKLEIFVPASSHVIYSAVNADVEIIDVQGSAHIDTVNGSIVAKNLGGRVRIESVNGNVLANELRGNVKIETVNGKIVSESRLGQKDWYDSVNGDIKVTSESPMINVQTVNGDMELNLGQIEQLNVESVNGDLEASLEVLKNSEVEVSSVGGDIDLFFKPDVSLKFDIEAHVGGNITNLLTEQKMSKAKYGPRRWLKGMVNGGEANLQISTVHGSVKMKN